MNIIFQIITEKNNNSLRESSHQKQKLCAKKKRKTKTKKPRGNHNILLMLDTGISHTDLRKRNDLLWVNYRNPNQLAGGESPLFYLANSYRSCKTQIIYPSLRLSLTPSPAQGNLLFFFLISPYLLSIPPTFITSLCAKQVHLIPQYKEECYRVHSRPGGTHWLLDLADM